MKKEIKYYGIEKITYRFTEQEVLDALRQYFKIKLTLNCEFEMVESYEDEPAYAELVVSFEKEQVSK